jgi:hypothetical protein
VDETARRAAAVTEQALAVLAGQVAENYAAKTTLAARAGAANAAHTAHAAALLEGLPATPTPTGSPTPASPAVTPQVGPVPATAAGAALALARAETAAAASHLAAMTGTSGPVATLLASVAASDLAFAASLRPLAVKPAKVASAKKAPTS